MTKRLEGKIAAITGGNEGIGLGIARRFAEEGAAVSFCYLSGKAQADAAQTGLKAMGVRTFAMQCDLAQVSEGQRFVAETIQALGPIDILVNNAGIEKRAEFWEVGEADFDAVLNVNLKAVFFVTQAFVKHRMQVKQPGRVINISSVHEELPFPHFASYCASKGALKMLARDLSIELAPLGITVNNIAPGAIETPINRALLNDPSKLGPLLKNIPLNRLGKPEDVAGVAAFLASPDAAYITGASFFVDGGLTWNYTEQ
jgi:glucose 1-dehydrogenase